MTDIVQIRQEGSSENSVDVCIRLILIDSGEYIRRRSRGVK